VRYFGRTLHPEFTDLAFVVGPNARWTEGDYEDLQRYMPEVLLGYRVRLFTEQDILQGRHRGYRPEKVVLLEGTYSGNRFYAEVRYAVSMGHFPKVEWWHVHRARGIWRVA
jgi:hypothetical protein